MNEKWRFQPIHDGDKEIAIEGYGHTIWIDYDDVDEEEAEELATAIKAFLETRYG